MTQYILYRSKDSIVPYVYVDENTINSSATSVFLIGKRKESYGSAEQQTKLWMLENFANSIKPNNSIIGQNWFNTVDKKLWVCTNDETQLYERVNKPIVSASEPTVDVSLGDLWYNTVGSSLYSYSSSGWVAVGSQSVIPISAQSLHYLTITTIDATPTEMLVGGVAGSRIILPQNSSWQFDISLIGRSVDIGTEAISIRFKGTIDRPNLGTVSIIGGTLTEIYNITSSLGGAVTAGVSANTSFNNLQVTVTGALTKTIKWNAIVNLTKVAN